MTELTLVGLAGLVLYLLMSAWQMARLEQQIALLWRTDTAAQQGACTSGARNSNQAITGGLDGNVQGRRQGDAPAIGG